MAKLVAFSLLNFIDALPKINLAKVHVEGEILVPRQAHVMCSTELIDEGYQCSEIADEQEKVQPCLTCDLVKKYISGVKLCINHKSKISRYQNHILFVPRIARKNISNVTVIIT